MNIHPQTVHFPIAILLVAGCIYAYHLIKQNQIFHQFAYLLHSIGVVGCALAIMSGRWSSLDLQITESASTLMNQHEWLAYGCLWGYALLWIWQYLRQSRMKHGEQIGFLISFWVMAILLGYTAHLGGTMVYDHGVGVGIGL